MKRFRHYNKDLAIVLSCFGSVNEQQRYLDLKEYISNQFNYPVYLSFSSKMVIKKLSNESEYYRSLPQILADLDMEGYRRVIVSSINLFPTNEHNFLLKIVDGFSNFSLARLRATDAIFSKTLDTTKIMIDIESKTKASKDITNLYIIHGTPEFKASVSINYVSDFINSRGDFFCSLEGAFPFFAQKEILLEKIRDKKVQIVPLLLVSGNHYKKDVKEILEFFESNGVNISITESLDSSHSFSLLSLESIQTLIKKYIENEIIKIS
jgi:sirohydrochlorin cobaltochelatase